MMKEKESKAKKKIFLVGVNLADGTRFEPGDAVPDDLAKSELDALKALGAIGEAN